MAGRYDARVFTVANQNVVAIVQGKAPERQHTPRGHVLAEGEPMGWHIAQSGESAASLVHFGADVGPDVRREGAQFLDPFPAGGDGLQRRRGQRSLPAVIEVGLVLQGRTQ